MCNDQEGLAIYIVSVPTLVCVSHSLAILAPVGNVYVSTKSTSPRVLVLVSIRDEITLLLRFRPDFFFSCLKRVPVLFLSPVTPLIVCIPYHNGPWHGVTQDLQTFAYYLRL